MKSTATSKRYLPTPKELNIKRLLGILQIQFLQNCDTISCFSVDFIYGYSYLIPSEFSTSYFLFALQTKPSARFKTSPTVVKKLCAL